MYHLKEATVSSHPLEIEFAKQLGKCYFKEFQSASMQHPNHNIAFPRQQRNIGRVQGGWGGWPTGNGKKLSSCQAQLGQATCLAVA